MAQKQESDEVVFQTKWFDIVARRSPGSADPHYLINSSDFVAVVALTKQGNLLLVRQFRPAVGHATLEVPSGHVERGETPEIAARKELLEETGHVSDRFELLATVSPAIGRFTNRMWCYFARDARPTDDATCEIESGIELVPYSGTVRALSMDKEFWSSLSHSSLLIALAHGRLKLD
jgi:ADP-ribose pyrophosphatase